MVIPFQRTSSEEETADKFQEKNLLIESSNFHIIISLLSRGKVNARHGVWHYLISWGSACGVVLFTHNSREREYVCVCVCVLWLLPFFFFFSMWSTLPNLKKLSSPVCDITGHSSGPGYSKQFKIILFAEKMLYTLLLWWLTSQRYTSLCL